MNSSIDLSIAADYASAAHQLDQLTRFLCENEQNNLIGVYLHGSLAMGCFQPGGSDLDVLVLLEHSPTPDHRRRWAELLLQISDAPSPIEISFLHRSQYSPWLHPTPYDFHFSKDWRAQMENQLAAGDGYAWEEAEGTDVDLAAHFTVARRRGVRLCGELIGAALPDVPWMDYWDSISRDVLWAYQRGADNPIYLVLNCCRVWAAADEQLVLSKAEGAVWAEQRLPPAQVEIVAAALALYTGQATAQQAGALTPASALTTARWMCAQMQLTLPGRTAATE